MSRRVCIIIGILSSLILASASRLRVEAPPERAYSAFSPDPSHQFNFWIGVWDVTMHSVDENVILDESVSAEASVYPIHEGKAILELWDSRSIKGFSFRSYDPVAEEWNVWLSWPRSDHPALEKQTGSFRHGRGEFRDVSLVPNEPSVTRAYSFTDITPFSLRWEEQHSSDAGETWRRNLVMEFTRTAVDPGPLTRRTLPTAGNGEGCPDPRFHDFGLMAGTWRSENATFEARSILDGCAIIGLLEDDEGPDEFVFVTFDSAEEHWVALVLDDRPESGVIRYSGGKTWGELAATDERVGSIRWAILHSGPGSLGESGDRFYYWRDDRSIDFVRR